jgi:hypothetical protein
MICVIGRPTDPGTHLDHRASEHAAAPNVHPAASLIAAMDGIEKEFKSSRSNKRFLHCYGSGGVAEVLAAARPKTGHSSVKGLTATSSSISLRCPNSKSCRALPI